MTPRNYLKEIIVWSPSGDPEIPFKAKRDGVVLSVQVNDFPADHLYTLVVGDSSVNFDEWPKTWTKHTRRIRSKRAITTARAKASSYTRTAEKSTRSKTT